MARFASRFLITYMEDKKKEKKESVLTEKERKYLPLRIVGFVLAVIIAVVAITYGVVMIGHKDEGYSKVDADVIDNTLIYQDNIDFRYYFTGSSDEIKTALNELRNRYGVALSRVYRLLDADKEYDGYNNIKTVNVNAGTAVKVGSELYETLKDAYAKTVEKSGYNMFAGALYRKWNSILILDDPLEFDPLYNENEKNRIEKISEAVNDLDNFGLEFDDSAMTVKLTVSGNYRAFVNEYELTDAPIIDLNLLHDAYEIQLIAADLEEKGYKDGFFSSDNGLMMSLSEHDRGLLYDFTLYDNGNIMPAATAGMKKGSVVSKTRAYAEKSREYFYYTADLDGVTYRRNPYVPSDGVFSDVVMSSYIYSDTSSLADVCYESIKIVSKKTAEEVSELVNSMKNPAAYTLQSDTKPKLYTNSSAAEYYTVSDDYK